MSRKRHTQPTELPELKEGQILCQIQGPPRGSNLFDAWDGKDIHIVELPARFRKSAWIKRGSHIIVELSNRDPSSKIHGEIIHVLLAEHVKQWKKRGDWMLPDEPAPAEEVELAEDGKSLEASSDIADQGSDADSDEEPLWENPNRR